MEDNFHYRTIRNPPYPPNNSTKGQPAGNIGDNNEKYIFRYYNYKGGITKKNILPDGDSRCSLSEFAIKLLFYCMNAKNYQE